MLRSYATVSVEIDAKEQLLELKNMGFATISDALRYAVTAARDSKRLEQMLGVDHQ